MLESTTQGRGDFSQVRIAPSTSFQGGPLPLRNDAAVGLDLSPRQEIAGRFPNLVSLWLSTFSDEVLVSVKLVLRAVRGRECPI